MGEGATGNIPSEMSDNVCLDITFDNFFLIDLMLSARFLFACFPIFVIFLGSIEDKNTFLFDLSKLWLLLCTLC